MLWVNQYIGVPFRDHGRDPSGWDCWGLVCWCLRHHFGLSVPSFDDEYESALQPSSVRRVISKHKPEWGKVELGDERPGDVLLLRMDGVPIHVGLCIGKPLVLHVLPGPNTIVEEYTEPQHKVRVLGVYRYAA